MPASVNNSCVTNSMLMSSVAAAVAGPAARPRRASSRTPTSVPPSCATGSSEFTNSRIQRMTNHDRSGGAPPPLVRRQATAESHSCPAWMATQAGIAQPARSTFSPTVRAPTQPTKASATAPPKPIRSTPARGRVMRQP